MGGWKRFKRNRLAVVSLGYLVIVALVAILADVIAPHPYDRQDLRQRLLLPSTGYPFGTDELGRCLLSRIIVGTRISFVVGFLIVAASMTIGVALGVISGYYGGSVDLGIMRLIDIILSFPAILLALAIVAALGAGLVGAVVSVIVVAVPAFARLARSKVLSTKEEEYVEAARASGASDTRIIRRHIIPNSISPIIIQASLEVPRAVIFVATLSFLGIGAQPPMPEWGAMLNSARNYLRMAPHLTLFTGSALFVTALAFNAVGDGMRDALDPHARY